MKLLLIGYGKMGRIIHQEAENYGFSVINIVDHTFKESDDLKTNTLSSKAIEACDVAIEFAHPKDLLQRIALFNTINKPLIVGTTGWEEIFDQVKMSVQENQATLLWGSNFSLGVILFQKIVEAAGRLMKKAPQYDASIVEYHHKEKKDMPSGTAFRLMDSLKKSYETEDIPVTAHRSGYFPGTHEVLFDSLHDTIKLIHDSRSRSAFAVGALLLAQWIIGKQGFFSVEDALNALLKEDLA